ncbi:hypothetical protein CBM2609_U10085 [Cupriavidus taiwanensis]|nr:hypothetical protein CBM2604_U10008 [Cupriavidus taiwanensis]SOZ34489.1 hypothetical protein CBM2609_U10085 [Cupriavidus taiwanensis]SOZ52975.1 hypothetical protein CBM2610_U10008 [Cupriavidus taiwanensis]
MRNAMAIQQDFKGTRREHDLLGYREVPADAYYGIHTLRALENFPITGDPISRPRTRITLRWSWSRIRKSRIARQICCATKRTRQLHSTQPANVWNLRGQTPLRSPAIPPMRMLSGFSRISRFRSSTC